MKMKIEKPTSIDCALLYLCPGCQNKHWIYLIEAQTKNFKIVCDCGTVFKPKQIDKLKIQYQKSTKTVSNKKPNNKVPIDILDQCVKVLVGYGFTKSESVRMIEKSYCSSEDKSIVNLIKIALSSLEIKDV